MMPPKPLLSDVPQLKSTVNMQKSLELHVQQLESTLQKMKKPLASDIQQVKAHVGELWVECSGM